ncbi:acylglycerol kinase family protein [Candidatus Saccharibacteria bacterium]|nr:acylglycerol kinase family protein [Candidatus Saccharibacteria bacterium]
MKRLIIVYNPRSTRAEEVQRKVIEEARKLRGWMFGRFEIRNASVRENAKELAQIIRKDDLVVSAGGDGTASAVINAIVLSGKKATMAGMGFGNFNDFSGTFGEMSLTEIVRKYEEGRQEEFYPLEIEVNGKHFLYAGLYFTMGMFAESTRVFQRKSVRRGLARAKNRLFFSARKLFFWYLKNKWRKNLLPEAIIDKTQEGNVVKFTTPRYTTDYVALNGESLAGVVGAKGWTRQEKKFWSGEMRNRSLFRMVRAFIKSAEEGELPGTETEGDTILFREPSKIFVHAEGEAEVFYNVSEVRVRKTGEKFRVIRK